MPNETLSKQTALNEIRTRGARYAVRGRAQRTLLLATSLLSGCGARAEESLSTDTGNPGGIDEQRIHILPGTNVIVVSGEPKSVPSGSRVTVVNETQATDVATTAERDGSFEVQIASDPGDALVLQVNAEGKDVRLPLDVEASSGAPEASEGAQPTATSAELPAEDAQSTLPPQCEAKCADPCNGCDEECIYFVGQFSCCQGDLCAVIGCGDACAAPSFDAIVLDSAYVNRTPCEGECASTLSFQADARISLEVTSRRIKPTRENGGVLTEQAQVAIEDALSRVTPAVLAAQEGDAQMMPPPAGTTEASENRGIRLQLEGARTGFSYGVPVAELLPLTGIVGRLHSALFTCKSDEFIAVEPDCVPPDSDAAEARLDEALAFERPAPSCNEELHVIALDGIASGAFNQEGVESSARDAFVYVERPGVHVLGLSSYAAARWEVVAASPDVVIEKVILNGYYSQSASVPEGTEVEIHDNTDPQSDLYAYVDDWPVAYSETPDASTDDATVLVYRLEELSGLGLTSYSSCTSAGGSFVLGADLSVAGTCGEGPVPLTFVAPLQCEQ